MTQQHDVRFGLRSSQNHRSWQQIRDNFLAAEEWGLESAWVYDHIIPRSGPLTGPNLEGWTLLAGLAEATRNVLLGTMVTGITYRNPGMLLKEAVTVDHISNGRCLLALGAAWYEEEHVMYGFDYPSNGDRVSMLNEALEMFELLQTQDVSNYEGMFYQLREAVFEPKPIQQQDGKPHLPVVIGGSKRRMLGIVARHADQWDNNFTEDSEYRERLQMLEAACDKIGRDVSAIRRSTTLRAGFFDLDESAQRRKIESLRELGLTDILFHAPPTLEKVRPFMEEQLPRIRASI